MWRRSNPRQVVIANNRFVPQLKDVMTLVKEYGDESAMKQSATGRHCEYSL
jgi:hypothetical protein